MAPMQVRRWLVLALIAVVAVSASNSAFAGNRRRGRRSGGGTAASAAMAGQARVLASQAQAQAMQAQAAKNLEAAKAAEIRNRMLWTQAANRENIENGRRSAEASQHPRGDPATVSQRSLPPKLDRHELDSVTGAIDYPLVLLDSRLDTPRREVDRLFRIRAERGSLDAVEMRELDAALTGFHEELRALVGQYSAGDYGHGATFLERLRYEIRHPEQQLPLESNE